MLVWNIISLILFAMVFPTDADQIHVSTKSIGCNRTCGQCSSFIAVNSQESLIVKPGLHIVAISNETGRVMYNSSFDYLSLIHKRRKLKKFLSNIPEFFFVIVTVHQQCLAKIFGWYHLLRKYSNLRFLTYRNATRNIISPSIIVTCQKSCPLGTKDLPFYRFELQQRDMPVYGNVSIQFGVSSASDSNAKDLIDDTLFSIILAVSVATILILIFLILAMVFCCKNINASRQNMKMNQSTTSLSTTKTTSRFQKWVRQKEIKDINKEILKKSPRKELDNRSYIGDIVRGSVSTSTLSRDFHMLSSDYENVFEENLGNSKRYLGRSVSVALSNHTLRSHKDTDGYLQPVDILRKHPKALRVNGANTTSHLGEPYRSNCSMNHLESVTPRVMRSKQNSTMEIAVEVSEKHQQSETNVEAENPDSVYSNLYPGSSQKIFLSQASLYTTPEQQSIVTKETDQNSDTREPKFAEYCQLEVNGPLYKKPSDVVRHNPPEYSPSQIPKIVPRADSTENTENDYENVKMKAKTSNVDKSNQVKNENLDQGKHSSNKTNETNIAISCKNITQINGNQVQNNDQVEESNPHKNVQNHDINQAKEEIIDEASENKELTETSQFEPYTSLHDEMEV